MLCADAALPGELGLRGHGGLAAVVPNPGDVLLLSESGWPRCPLIFSHSLFFQTVAEKAEHQEGGDRHRTQALRAADALARRVCLQPCSVPCSHFFGESTNVQYTVALRGFCLIGARPVWPLSLWGLCNIAHNDQRPRRQPFAIAIR